MTFAVRVRLVSEPAGADGGVFLLGYVTGSASTVAFEGKKSMKRVNIVVPVELVVVVVSLPPKVRPDEEEEK